MTYPCDLEPRVIRRRRVRQCAQHGDAAVVIVQARRVHAQGPVRRLAATGPVQAARRYRLWTVVRKEAAGSRETRAVFRTRNAARGATRQNTHTASRVLPV